MKKSTLYIGMALLMSTAFAQASELPESVAMTITGTVSGHNPSVSCGVYPATESVLISGENIVDQGAEPGMMNSVVIHVANPDDLSGCGNEVSAGHFALKLKGQPDNGQGTSLANTEAQNAASGVAIGMFDYNTKKMIPVNDGVLDIDKDSHTVKLGLEMVKLAGQEITDGIVTGSLTIELTRL
jgi:type 1 fimbria pilin